MSGIKRYNTLQENEPLGSVRPGDFRFRGCVEHPEGWLVTYTDHLAALQALAAPAPAPDECMACIGEKWGMPPGGAEPHTCEKAAPACTVCGGRKCAACWDFIKDKPHTPVPACKTCGDTKVVGHAHLVNGSDYRVKPCPDCTPTKEEKP